MAIIHYDVVFEKGSPGLLAIKEKLDPRGIFNPGRFVDGI